MHMLPLWVKRVPVPPHSRELLQGHGGEWHCVDPFGQLRLRRAAPLWPRSFVAPLGRAAWPRLFGRALPPCRRGRDSDLAAPSRPRHLSVPTWLPTCLGIFLLPQHADSDRGLGLGGVRWPPSEGGFASDSLGSLSRCPGVSRFSGLGSPVRGFHPQGPGWCTLCSTCAASGLASLLAIYIFYNICLIAAFIKPISGFINK
jgi:hypothetical protein